ncbi:M23 family metallopeptidase [Robiginitalea biformata]|uniref:M23 peptidase domain protein n=1 Tax=Robiginitalea biformata (strain ATCC BAA-864 / DSM 15991 / KCTC 12146 / HTCC2501) TaxID=313596 RepID=A4CHP7_ROBBH|nr:M23 family metallopeptidase [Robiginitalea biformata]EAR16455.1 M23 peptidase domain protein [Robiginitalea biformata HTCC2501]
MERFLFIFIHVGLPLLVLAALLRIRPKSRLALLGNTALYVLLLAFIYLWGQWPLGASLYYKYVVLAILLLCLWRFFRAWPALGSGNNRPTPAPGQTGRYQQTRTSNQALWWSQGAWRWIRTVAALLLAGLLAYPVYQLVAGRTYPDAAVPLTFPLRDGRYYIASGGSNVWINNHHRASTPAQRYALDINKLEKWGMATQSLWATENSAHAIFGAPVYAPCKGRVLEVKSHVPDNRCTSMDVAPEDGMGNYVVLDCDGTIIHLVHLQHNRVAVAPGQRVLTGDRLGSVGNSGFSQEPHLHFQAARYQADFTLVGVPMEFEGRGLVRGDVEVKE